MDLKAICMKNIVELIKNLPPLLKEEVIGKSLKSINEEAEIKAKKSLMKQLRRDAAIVVEDVTNKIVESRVYGTSWRRPDYTMNIDDEMYNIFVHVSEQFVGKYEEHIIFSRHIHGMNLSDSDEGD